jgi:CheY-like chemotaxis protein
MASARNIFLVEDDEDDQILFTMAVKEIDNSICLNQAKNGVEALTKLDNINPLPYLIFMDINMPLMNGLECLGHLKNHIHFKNIPIVILSTTNNPAHEELATVLGANFFLMKSNFSLLQTKIGDMLNLFAPINQNKKYMNI